MTTTYHRHCIEYVNRIRTKFPAPAGFRELKPFETGVVHDRRHLGPKEIIGWDDEFHASFRIDGPGSVSEFGCWWVVRDNQ